MTDFNSSERSLTELQIARAYVSLSSNPEDDLASVLLTTSGSCEIRMFRSPKVHLDGVPLFWLELFNTSTNTSVDSFVCFRIKDAVSVFEDFVSQVS